MLCPADDRAICLDHLRQSPSEHFFEDFDLAAIGKAHQGERADRPAAHRVNVTERIGGGDLAEDVGIVDNRGKEIDGLYQGYLRGELIHARVVGGIEADEHIGIMLPG